ncbi:MAG: hypothetical protein GW947_01530 [Candidatus Pacebacteria bacterium]|nr:hypothetical protein [Candidatus Paceibacterota bacterium]PIR59796.1 MAG: hypothetical protein COU68_03705 [Candidatus Pacebacteria bacterium CG10_big_fil_rev_8_21_14_0_10_45_6]
MTPFVSASLVGGLSLLLLLVAAELFVWVSTRLAQIWRISPLITSLIIVALGTNVPEFAVSIGSIVRNDPGLALGNLIGSSVTNLSLIFGVSILFGLIKPGTVKTQINAWMLLSITLLFTSMSLLHLGHKLQALYLLAAMLAVVSYQFLLGIRGRRKEDKASLRRVKSKKLGPLGITKYVFLLIIAIALVWIGGNQVVASLTVFSTELGISTTVLGLTLAGIATTLPELLTTLTASFQHQNKVAIGTVLGSNIFNLTLFPAIVFGTVGTWYINPRIAAILLAVTLLFVGTLVQFRGRPIPRYFGLIFLSAYFCFLFVSTHFQTNL